jgi:hypothetical protein
LRGELFISQIFHVGVTNLYLDESMLFSRCESTCLAPGSSQTGRFYSGGAPVNCEIDNLPSVKIKYFSGDAKIFHLSPTSITISTGSVLITASKSLTIHTPHGIITTSGNAALFISARGQTTTVLNLLEEHYSDHFRFLTPAGSVRVGPTRGITVGSGSNTLCGILNDGLERRHLLCAQEILGIQSCIFEFSLQHAIRYSRLLGHFLAPTMSSFRSSARQAVNGAA